MDPAKIPYTPLHQVEIDRIDALRGFLCIAILTFHYFSGTLTRIADTPAFLTRFLSSGSFAVHVFFALSGFLLFHSYSKSIQYQQKSVNLTFYLKRIFRIYPVWAVVLLAFALIHPSDIKTYFWNLFFLFGLKPYAFKDILAFHSWSLYVEEMFYICFPLLLLIYKRRWTFYAFIFFFLFHIITEMAPVYSNGQFYHNPFNTFQYFFGGLFAYFYISELRKIRISRLLFYLCLATAIVLPCMYQTESFIWSYSACSFLILFGSPEEFSKVFTFLFRRMGRICYSFYLFHPIGLMLPGKVPLPQSLAHSENFWSLSLAIHFVLSFLFSVCGAVLLYYVIEKPGIRMGKKIIHQIKSSEKPGILLGFRKNRRTDVSVQKSKTPPDKKASLS